MADDKTTNPSALNYLFDLTGKAMAPTMPGAAALFDLIGRKLPPNQEKNVGRALFGQGLMMGWGDEAEAWLRSKISGSEGYPAELKKIHSEYGQFASDYPKTQSALEFGGGAIPAVVSLAAAPATGGATSVGAAPAAGALGRLANFALTNPYARGAVTGATAGGISGAGAAQPGERVSGAIGGAELGTALGATIPAVFRGGVGAYNWLRSKLAPTEEFVTQQAARNVNEALADAGLTPAQAALIVESDRAQNIPSTLANVSIPTVSLAETVANRGGKSPRVISQKLSSLQDDARERVLERARTDISSGDYFNDKEQLIRDMRKKAKTLYDDAYFDPQGNARVVDDPDVQYILTHPRFREAYQRGKAIAKTDAMLAKIDGEDPSRYVLPEIYDSVPTGQFDPITNAPIMTERLRDSLPTVQTLDYVKRGLDEIIDSAYTGSSSVGKGEAGGLKGLRDRMTAAIDKNVPEYKQARASYAGDAEVKNAMDLGYEQFRSMAPEEVFNFMKDASPAEAEAFRSGVVRNLYDVIMTPAANVNAGRILSAPRTLKKLQAIFPDQAQFDLFKAAMMRENQLYQETGTILGNSRTAPRLAAKERFEEEPAVGEAVAGALTGSPTSGLMGMINTAMRRGRKFSDEKATKVAELLMSSDPHEVAAAVQVLENQASMDVPKELLASGAELGATSGTMAALPIAPLPPEKKIDLESALAEEEKRSEAELPQISLEDLLKEEEEKNKGKNIPGDSMNR